MNLPRFKLVACANLATGKNYLRNLFGLEQAFSFRTYWTKSSTSFSLPSGSWSNTSYERRLFLVQISCTVVLSCCQVRASNQFEPRKIHPAEDGSNSVRSWCSGRDKKDLPVKESLCSSNSFSLIYFAMCTRTTMTLKDVTHIYQVGCSCCSHRFNNILRQAPELRRLTSV